MRLVAEEKVRPEEPGPAAKRAPSVRFTGWFGMLGWAAAAVLLLVFTATMLVQRNGRRTDLRIAGIPIGEEIRNLVPERPSATQEGHDEPAKNSLLVLVATDAPLQGDSPLQSTPKLGRYYNYPEAEWLQATYAAAGTWHSASSGTSEIRSFDETPATLLHLVVRKPAG